ncbi:MAG: sodium:solute symporter [Acidobacteriales bacterium]|nr:MAG: sodium:solute symporter [Terriglobales bacterium]
MRLADWVVMCGALAFVVLYGLWRGRGSNSVDKYLLAGKTMPWHAMAFSIMATQASAVTFISTTGQSYVDGMRFVQFYFGLPLAMIVLSMTAVPIFHRSKAYTAYEYLEQRFDAKTRALVSAIFLIQRGLALGITLYAPAVVLTVILGWPDRATTLVMGGIAILYTTLGGVKTIAWTDFQQMLVMTAGMLAALASAVLLLPSDVSFFDAVTLAGAAGRLNAVTLNMNWNDRYNLWSGLIGGMFLALAYFGCDQSQVQRYLTGKSIAQSRLSLLFNGMAKIPMQFFILFIGTMVFVFYVYEKPPVLFEKTELARIQSPSLRTEYAPVEQDFSTAFESRKVAANRLLAARRSGDAEQWNRGLDEYGSAQRELDSARRRSVALVEKAGGPRGLNDTNYIFLTFVTNYLPAGLVGLVLAVVFGATMAAISAEMNSLATVSVIDIYKRHFRKAASDRHYLNAARAATVFRGCYAVISAEYGKKLGSLIEAVNILGSLFYGGMLGVFVLAFFFPLVRARGSFYGVLSGEAVLFACYFLTKIAFLWYNVIGCIVVVLMGILISSLERTPARQAA